MRIISLPDGTLEFVKHDDELIDIVDVHMGYEMSLIVKELIENADEIRYKTESDLLSYELSLEECRDGFLELKDIIEPITNMLDSKKINKNKLKDEIDKMENIINKHI